MRQRECTGGREECPGDARRVKTDAARPDTWPNRRPSVNPFPALTGESERERVSE